MIITDNIKNTTYTEFHAQHKHGMYITTYNPVLESLLHGCLHRNKSTHALASKNELHKQAMYVP
jgi:hypothetical protein